MPEPMDKPKTADPLSQPLEDATISRPTQAFNHPDHMSSNPEEPGQSNSLPLPASFLDTLLEVIAKSIEQTLADLMAHCVSRCVEDRLRPLIEEIALLRTAIEHDWDDRGQRRGDNPPA